MALILKNASGQTERVGSPAVAVGIGTDPDGATGVVPDNPLSADRLLDVHKPDWTTGDDVQVRIGDLILNSRHSGSSDLQADNQRGANGNLGLGCRGLIFFYTHDDPSAISVKMRISNAGNVGIGPGLKEPQERLEVDGNIVATGDVRLVGADCAEEFDFAEGETVLPGAVMVIRDDERLGQCTDAYDTRAAGVISGAGSLRPGILLGQHTSPQLRGPLALTGTVYCCVDASFGAIRRGDLLTTSCTTGHAMRASDPSRSLGAIIGKALRPLDTGRGLIPILVALQ